MSNGTHRLLFALILAAALAVRLAYFLEARSTEWYSHPRLDALFHDQWALSIARGDIVGDSVFFRAPLYAYLLAAVYAIAGHHYDAPRILQHLLGVAVVGGVFLLARRIYGPIAAIVAGLLTGFSAVLVYFEGELLFDSLVAALLIFWLVVVEWIGSRDRPLMNVLAGTLFGLLCITRPTFLALAPLVFCWIAVRTGRATNAAGGMRTGTALFVGCVLMIAPVTLRNALVGRDFVLISSQGGINFYIGSNPRADGISSSLPDRNGLFWLPRDMESEAEHAVGRRLSPSEQSSYWYGEAWKFIRSNPEKFLTMMMRKLVLFWNYQEIPNNRMFTSVAARSVVLSLLPVGFWLLGPLGLLGMFFAFRTGRGRLLASVVLMHAAVTALFFVADRFRVPVLPVLSILAGFAVAEVIERVRRRAFRGLVVAGIVGMVAAGFVNMRAIVLATEDPAREEFVHGLMDLGEGRNDAAAAHFRSAAAIRPLPNLHANWGVAAWEMGDTGTAIQQFRRELEVTPGSPPALTSLALIELARGRADSALALAHRAIQADPCSPGGYTAAARSLQVLRQDASAESVLLLGRTETRRPFLYGDFLITDLRLRRTGDIPAADSAYRAVLHELSGAHQPRYEPEVDYGLNSVTGVGDRTLQAYTEYRIGHLSVLRSELDSAFLWFRRATTTLPAFADAWADCGVTLLRLHRPAAAESCLAIATRLDPRSHLYWYDLGVVRRQLREPAAAAEAFREAVQRAPGFRPAVEALAEVEGMGR